MSSMRNAVQRRNHKERAQPTERGRWGLLEKHKDYSLRAADHNQKKRKLKALQQKASERNEDEFYFAMVNAETEGGRKRARRAEANGGGTLLREEVVRLMKTQDAGYLRTTLLRTKRLRERVEREVVESEVGVDRSAVPSAKSGTKIVFGEDGGGRPAVPVPVEDEDDDHLADLDGFYSDEEAGGDNEEDAEEEEGLSREEIATRRRKRKLLDAKRRQLEALRDREEQLSTALRGVEDQRARMAGKVGAVNKHGTKFKVRQRK